MLADANADRREVGVDRADAMAVVDRDFVPPTAVAPPGPDDAPCGRRFDANSRGRNDVDAGMKPIAARSEWVADRAGDWPAQCDRRLQRRTSQRREHCRPCDPVRRQMCPALE